jgi:protein O-GlcNAc transferase
MPQEKFLLIKAWGYGFWSDVSHVLSQILVAEVAGRIPVVHWGSNSLFNDGTDSNAFEYYFNPVSGSEIKDLQQEDCNFWPPKWNHQNLLIGEINKITGPFSRVSGLELLKRTEKVVVSDFYTSVVDLMPCIPAEHHLYGISIDDLYHHLICRYLHPKQEIVNRVNAFYESHLADANYLAVHVRGSDKAKELNKLEMMNKFYFEIIDNHLRAKKRDKIFLMTDDARIFRHFVKRYGSKIIAADCQRTDTAEGIHYQKEADKRLLGIEVMVDVYVAAKANAFLGIGFSNPSLIIKHLKKWAKDEVYLLGENMYHSSKLYI